MSPRVPLERGSMAISGFQGKLTVNVKAPILMNRRQIIQVAIFPPFFVFSTCERLIYFEGTILVGAITLSQTQLSSPSWSTCLIPYCIPKRLRARRLRDLFTRWMMGLSLPRSAIWQKGWTSLNESRSLSKWGLVLFLGWSQNIMLSSEPSLCT